MYQRIMVPLDGSELAECVLPHVAAIARGWNIAKVTLVRVVEFLHLHGGIESGFSPEERQRLEADSIDIARKYLDQRAQRLKDIGIAAQSAVIHGHVIDELTDYAEKNGVDLVVIATHGRSGVSHWVWGSIAERILRSSRVPVLMVRAFSSVPAIWYPGLSRFTHHRRHCLR